MWVMVGWRVEGLQARQVNCSSGAIGATSRASRASRALASLSLGSLTLCSRAGTDGRLVGMASTPAETEASSGV